MARKTIDATCSTKPAHTATRAGTKMVCFFLSAVRTECAKPTKYRPSASLSRTTCMAGIIAHGSGRLPCAIIREVIRDHHEHCDLCWYCSIHRLAVFLERPRIGARLDCRSSGRSHRPLSRPGIPESDGPCRHDGHHSISIDRNLRPRRSDVRL